MGDRKQTPAVTVSKMSAVTYFLSHGCFSSETYKQYCSISYENPKDTGYIFDLGCMNR